MKKRQYIHVFSEHGESFLHFLCTIQYFVTSNWIRMFQYVSWFVWNISVIQLSTQELLISFRSKTDGFSSALRAITIAQFRLICTQPAKELFSINNPKYMQIDLPIDMSFIFIFPKQFLIENATRSNAFQKDISLQQNYYLAYANRVFSTKYINFYLM